MTATGTVGPKRPRGFLATKFVLAIACAAAFCGIAAAQGGGWAAVEGISPGSRVEIRLSPHGIAKGMVVGVSASGVDIQSSNGSIRHVARAQIGKVFLLGKSHKLRGGLIGAVIGGAGGVALVLAKYNPSSASSSCIPPCVPLPQWPKAAVAAVYAAAIGGLGAVIGAVIGSHHSRTLVYRRESGRSPGDRRSEGQNATSRSDTAHPSPAAFAGAVPR